MLSAWWLSCCMKHRITLAPERQKCSCIAHAAAVQTNIHCHRHFDVFAKASGKHCHALPWGGAWWSECINAQMQVLCRLCRKLPLLSFPLWCLCSPQSCGQSCWTASSNCSSHTCWKASSTSSYSSSCSSSFSSSGRAPSTQGALLHPAATTTACTGQRYRLCLWSEH